MKNNTVFAAGEHSYFFKPLYLITLAESLGGVESLVCHPASMTHASIPYEVRQKVGITDGLIRLYIGVESVDEFAGRFGAGYSGKGGIIQSPT